MRPAIHKVLEFNGKRYYKRGRYYRSDSRGPKPDYMHRDVWRHFNGAIPAKHHVHHKDDNPANNRIDNLELLPASQHNALHSVGKVPNWRKGVAAARGVKRDWAKAGRALWANRAVSKYSCVLCSKTFTSRAIQRVPLFCGQNCQKKYRRREAKQGLSSGS